MAVVVLGRFPPPIDGQSLATERLADLLEPDLEISRVNTQPPQGGALEGGRHRLKRTAHFFKQRPRLREALLETIGATVLWASISPDPLGHLRDLLVTVPSLRKEHRVYAVVHRGNFHRLFARPYTAPTARRLVNCVQGFVFTSIRLSERCSRWIPNDKRFSIPNTIDDDLIFEDTEVEAKRLNRKGRQKCSVLFLSNMVRSKGYLDTLDALVLMQKNGTAVEAHFVGAWKDEKDQAEFLDRVVDRDLEDVVTHHGAVTDRRAIKEFYRAADLFILPTYYPNEAQPLVIIEAMNAGTPVIATAHASIPEIIENRKEGMFVPAKNPAAIAWAAHELIDDKTWQRSSELARQRFVNTFSPERVREQWLNLIG